ncbi:DUF4190 domain-containing protein [Peribacillus frigoritolerans]|uniref:DUF4190 domain-containing protein n=1 Tax=Peribacillus castrilensis TaxID=2897690 RepID=A0AAW9NPM5_9BACI|nr:DUF4190 domain-containing protein [Peribacillus castrilensis]MEC0298125.1 DUF4190 domain-containing protein [Peribacillus castrilensis]MEC0344671.1 DUF4190 domain-containing protein [Peribacillus castrilensis]
MEKDQYSSIDDEMQLAKEGSEPSVVDDQHHERYYNEDTPEDDRRYESHGTITNLDNRYQEETSAEISTPPQRIRSYKNDEPEEDNGLGGVASRGKAIGVIALIISILSLFMMPFLLGIVGIIVGIVARSRGSNLGTWAIGIGAVSIIVGIFIAPFF